MGISKSKSKSKTKNEPWKPAQPYILKGLEQSGRVFDAQQPQLEGFAKMQRDSYGRLAPGAERGISGSQGLVNRTLNGDYLEGNPYLDRMLGQTRENTENSVASQFSSAGRYGSGNHAGILAKAIADAENGARYNNYAAERQNQMQAIGQAQSLMGGSQSLLNNAAELPWLGVGALNGNVRQASNGYGTQTATQTQTQPGGWGQMLMGAAAGGLNAYAASDRRLKVDVVKVGEEPDGLGVYDYNYRQDTPLELPQTRQRGVMADEVAILRPWAFIPNFGHGFAGVDYGRLA